MGGYQGCQGCQEGYWVGGVGNKKKNKKKGKNKRV